MELPQLRSLLFAPAAEEAKLRKALASQADAVIADLEDGTAPDEKDAGREIVQALYTDAEPGRALGLRVNPPGSEWFDRDLELARGLRLDFLMLPKATPDTVAALERGVARSRWTERWSTWRSSSVRRACSPDWVAPRRGFQVRN